MKRVHVGKSICRTITSLEQQISVCCACYESHCQSHVRYSRYVDKSVPVGGLICTTYQNISCFHMIYLKTA